MFRQLGINFVQRGVYDVARAVDRLNLVFRSYNRVIQQSAKASVTMARDADKAAKVIIRDLTPGFKNATTGAFKFNQSIINTKVSLGDYAKELRSGTAQSRALDKSVEELVKRYLSLNETQKELSKVENMTDKQRSARIGNMTRLRNEIAAIIIATGKHHQKEAEGLGIKKNIEKAIQALVVALAQQKVAMTDGAKFIKAYEEALAKGKTEAKALDEALKASAQGGNKFQNTMTWVRNATLATISAVQGAIGVLNIITGVFTGLFNIVKAIVSPILKLAVAIGKTLVNAFKALIKLPFQILKSAFNTIWTSLQRIFDIVVGTLFSRGLQNLGNAFRELAKTVFDAATEFQLVEIRLEALTQRELQAAGYNLADSMRMAKEETKELVDWVTILSVQSIFEAEDILNMHALGMSYGFTSDMAQDLTESILNFATGMGLSGVEMNRIIENFGQMRQQGKITGTELRDLARGAFVPVGAVLEQMGVDLEVISGIKLPSLVVMKDNLKKLAHEGKISNEELARMSKLLDDNSRGSAVTATTLVKLAKSGELSEEALSYLGTTMEAIELAANDLTFAELTKELNELVKTGEITVDEFFIAFMNMVGQDFPDAMKNAAATMKTVRQNFKDFFVTMIGWRVVAPILEVVARRLTDTLNKLLGDDVIELFDNFGQTLQLSTKIIFGWIDAIQIPDINLDFFSKAIEVFGNLFAVFSAINTGDLEIFEAANLSLLRFLTDLTTISGLDMIDVWNIRDAFEDLFDVFTNMGDLPSDEIFERVKTSLLAIFTPLWEQVLQPELVKLVDAIKNFIVTKWENDIKPALNDFIQNVILPGLNKFITETVPRWAGIIAEHIPAIATAFGTGLYNALDSLSTWAGENEGILFNIVEVLADIGKYLGLSLGAGKMEGMTPSAWQYAKDYLPGKEFGGSNFEASGLAQSLKDLGEAAGEAVEDLKLLLADALDPLIEWGDKATPTLEAIDALIGYINSMKPPSNLGALGDFFSSIANIFGGGDGDKGDSGGIAKWIEKIAELGTLSNDILYIPWKLLGAALELAGVFFDNLGLLIEEISGYGSGFTLGDLGNSLVLFFENISTSLSEESIAPFSDVLESWGKLFGSDKSGPLYDLLDGIKEFQEELQGLGNEPLEKVPFTDMGEQAIQKLEETISAIETLTEPLGQKSMFEDWEKATVEGMQQVSDDLIMTSIIPDMISAIQSHLDENVPGFENPFVEFFSNLINLFEENMAIIISDVDDFISTLFSSIESVNLYPAGESIFQGLLDGLKSKFEEIITYIEWAAVEIREAWELAQQIESPSKVWERLGLMTMAGLERGMEKGFGRVLGVTATGMSNLRDTAGLTRGGAGASQYNYNNSISDNRNININYANSSNSFSLDYDYVRAIT